MAIMYIHIHRAIRCIADACIRHPHPTRPIIVIKCSDIIVFYFLSRFYVALQFISRVSCNEAAINTKDLTFVALFVFYEGGIKR